MEFFDWLFGTRMGVFALFVGGAIIALIVAIILERGLSKRYYNHEVTAGEEDESIFSGLFDGSDEE